jgi:hypothetical protein
VWAEYERDALIRLIAWWCIDPPAPLRSNLPDSVSQALRCSQFATGGTPEVVFVYELAVHEAWVRLGGAGNVDFAAFVAAYDDFYDRFALDGHEPDGLDQALLRDHAATIDIHRRIRDEVLYLVCRAEDAEREAFRAAGRIGPDQAVRRLATFAKLLLAQRGAGGV